ncbi:DUF5953 family protein [Pedobacter sp. NJ-S-72]
MFNFKKKLDEIIYPNILDYYLVDPGIPKPIANFDELIEESEQKNTSLILNTGDEANYCGISFYRPYKPIRPLYFFSAIFEIPHFPNSELIIFEKIKLLVLSIEVYNIYINHPEQNYYFKDHFIGWGMEDEPLKNNILPPITNTPDRTIQTWEYPVYFAWINYWSKDLLKKVGMNYEKDKNLFFKSVLLENEGILFQLTETPLNIDNKDHIELLSNCCYSRFNKIGNQHMLTKK